MKRSLDRVSGFELRPAPPDTPVYNRFGRENVVGGSDCGFAQSQGLRRVPPSIMWAKLRALADGARLASQHLFE